MFNSNEFSHLVTIQNSFKILQIKKLGTLIGKIESTKTGILQFKDSKGKVIPILVLNRVIKITSIHLFKILFF